MLIVALSTLRAIFFEEKMVKQKVDEFGVRHHGSLSLPSCVTLTHVT